MNILNSSDESAVRIDSLTAHPEKPRRGDIQAVAESIDANGFYAVLAQVSTRRILESESVQLVPGPRYGFREAAASVRSGWKFDGLEIPTALPFIAFQERPGMETGKRHFPRLKVFFNVGECLFVSPNYGRCRPSNMRLRRNR